MPVLRNHLLQNLASLLPLSRLALNRPTVLAFHGVETHVIDERIQTAQHQIELFARTMAALNSRFEVLPLSYLSDALARPLRYRRSIFLTFDDGYANLLVNAKPILKQMQLPWALFVNTGHIGQGGRHPLYLFRQFVFYAADGSYFIPVLNKKVSLVGDHGRRKIARDLLMAFSRLSYDLAMECLSRLRDEISIEAWNSFPDYASESFLTYEQIRALQRDGVEIGSHAHWHWPMGEVSPDEYLRQQTHQSKELIERNIGPCKYFAYPYGGGGDLCARARKSVLDAGYEAAFTTLVGSLSTRQDKWLLPRYAVGPREQRPDNIIPLVWVKNPKVSKIGKSLTRKE